MLQDRGLLRDRGYVAGQWVEADNGGRFAVRDPASGAVVGQVPTMGAAETRRAIDAAAAAGPAWRARTAKDRAAILRRWYDTLS